MAKKKTTQRSRSWFVLQTAEEPNWSGSISADLDNPAEYDTLEEAVQAAEEILKEDEDLNPEKFEILEVVARHRISAHRKVTLRPG